MVLKKNFYELSVNELTEESGGMAPAVVYAAGFVLGTSPLTAVAIGVGAVSIGVALAISDKKSNKNDNKKRRFLDDIYFG